MNAVLKSSQETLREIAVEECCVDVEQYAGWLESASDEREMDAYFGAISVPELVRIVLAPKATDKQIAAAGRILRERYLTDFARDIDKRALELENI